MNQIEDREDILAVLDALLAENRFTEFRFAESYTGAEHIAHGVSLSCQRFSYTMSGTSGLDIGSGKKLSRCTFEPGCTLIMKPFCVTGFVKGFPSEGFGIVCHSNYLRIFHSMISGDGSACVHYYHLKDSLRLCTSHAVDALCSLHAGAEADALAPDMMRISLTLLKEDVKNSRGGEYGKTEDLWTRIVEHLSELPVAEQSRGRLSRDFHVTETYISRLFSRFAGMTFKEYLHSERLKKAVRLLDETNMTVGEIAWQCGFESPSYFIRIFRAAFGMPPGRHRRLKK